MNRQLPMSALFICPCRGPCPRCGRTEDDLDSHHPEDGLAYCPSCLGSEWWAHAGPHMDGRHLTGPVELAAWDAHDSAVMATRNTPTDHPKHYPL